MSCHGLKGQIYRILFWDKAGVVVRDRGKKVKPSVSARIKYSVVEKIAIPQIANRPTVACYTLHSLDIRPSPSIKKRDITIILL